MRDAWLVEQGAPVQVIFVAGALTISATAVTLAAGLGRRPRQGPQHRQRQDPLRHGDGRRHHPGRRIMMRALRPCLSATALGLQPALADGLTPTRPSASSPPRMAAPSTTPNTIRRPPPACSAYHRRQARCRPARSPRASRTSPSCRARATTSSSATAWSSACRAPATACATRRSPSSRSAPCWKTSASPREGGSARAKNVAAVIVTANLPPFVQSGARIDVDRLLDGRRDLACRRHADHDAAEGGRRRDLRRRARARSSFPASTRRARPSS